MGHFPRKYFPFIHHLHYSSTYLQYTSIKVMAGEEGGGLEVEDSIEGINGYGKNKFKKIKQKHSK